MTDVAPPPTSNYDDYLVAAAENAALPPDQWWFKRDPRYLRITEHVLAEQAHVFIASAQASFPLIWPLVADLTVRTVHENDSVGAPIVQTFPELGISTSPTNLRYMWHALLLLDYLKRTLPSKAHVFEIGGGYGGMALFVDRFARALFEEPILSYTLVDVPEALDLQAVFAHHFGLNVTLANGLDPADLTSALNQARHVPRLCFSAYGFPEFIRPIQDWYAERLVRHCEHGFMVWNYSDAWPWGANPVYAFVDADLDVQPGTLGDEFFVSW